ncbi:hypothetical protein N0V83_010448 [Neocucurbitaria cava]|uniref:Uncharacterized protein n=1 Tax=Neocucurbitaria cava TaxID=798079 RepID=A0A9W9CHF1_9PLEO|nr:hypothetical protein N0V83_010448 [Neocucurbitaria cava]
MTPSGRKLPLSPLRPTPKQDFGKRKPGHTQSSSSTKRPHVETGPPRLSKKPAITGAFVRLPLQVNNTDNDTTFLHLTRGVDAAHPAHKETSTKGSSAHRRPLLAPRPTLLQAPVTPGTTSSELKGGIEDVKASGLSLSSKVDLLKEEMAEFQQVVIHNQRLFGQALRELLTQSNCDASILDGLLAPAARDEREHVE